MPYSPTPEADATTSEGTPDSGLTPTQAAGNIGVWVREMAAVLQGTGGARVPCGSCVGCCSSHWPVALRQGDEAAAARFPASCILEPAHAPAGLRYAAPLPDGRCAMLRHGHCTIYEDRPQTCRDFDCRLFAATGIDSAGEDKPLINERIRAWRFSYASAGDAALHAALREAADFLKQALVHPASPRLPSSPVAIAGLAFKAHPVFLDESSRTLGFEALLQRVLGEIRRFDAAA